MVVGPDMGITQVLSRLSIIPDGYGVCPNFKVWKNNAQAHFYSSYLFLSHNQANRDSIRRIEGIGSAGFRNHKKPGKCKKLL
jgi:hypothetical protein